MENKDGHVLHFITLCETLLKAPLLKGVQWHKPLTHVRIN